MPKRIRRLRLENPWAILFVSRKEPFCCLVFRPGKGGSSKKFSTQQECMDFCVDYSPDSN